MEKIEQNKGDSKWWNGVWNCPKYGHNRGDIWAKSSRNIRAYHSVFIVICINNPKDAMI